jgi:hypothetical protein
MSAFARSPESYAAWQQLKRSVALRPHDDEQRAQRNRGTQELHRLLSRTSISILVLVLVARCSKAFHHSFPAPRIWEQIYIELQESPTPERLERFCRVSEEITRLAEQSFLRTLERDRYQDMCIADLQEGIENYRHMFDEHLRLVDFVHQQHVLALQKQIELEKRKRVYAENELRKATFARGGL